MNNRAIYPFQRIDDLPELVKRARELAARLHFEHSSSTETGRLLRVLAGQYISGTVAEIGTGCGVGSAWILSGLGAGTNLVTVELDEARSNAVAELFTGMTNLTLLRGDWTQIERFAPFVMLFADGGHAKASRPERLLAMMAPSGIVVLDDLTPIEQWPEEWIGKSDPVRAFWLNDRRVNAAEVRTRPSESVILATRLHET